MPSARVISYTVHMGRLGQLGTDRMIVLSHKAIDSLNTPGGAASSEIYFADRFGESASGFTTTGSQTSVRAHLPGADFQQWLDLLRHEDPIFLHWTESDIAGQPEQDGIIHLATGPEPTGEGPADFSPHQS